MPPGRTPRRKVARGSDDDAVNDAAGSERVDIVGAPDPANATPEQARKYNQRSVERVVAILNTLQESVDGQSLVQISNAVDLAKASTFRYLWTLERLRYVERDANGQYRLGLGFVGMQSRHLEVLRERARPWLEKLRDETGETSNLGILDGSSVIYLDIAESHHGVRMSRSRGSRDPIHGTALGKAIAAQLPEEQVRDLLHSIEMMPLTANTITTVEDYLEELTKVRRRGFAVDDGENDVDGRCVAVPILGSRLPAALSVSGPASRFPLKVMEEVAASLIEAAGHLASDRKTHESPES